MGIIVFISIKFGNQNSKVSFDKTGKGCQTEMIGIAGSSPVSRRLANVHDEVELWLAFGITRVIGLALLDDNLNRFFLLLQHIGR